MFKKKEKEKESERFSVGWFIELRQKKDIFNFEMNKNELFQSQKMGALNKTGDQYYILDIPVRVKAEGEFKIIENDYCTACNRAK